MSRCEYSGYTEQVAELVAEGRPEDEATKEAGVPSRSAFLAHLADCPECQRAYTSKNDLERVQ